MTTNTEHHARDRDWVTVDACTLPTVDQGLRVAEFDALFAETLQAIEATRAGRARLVMSGERDLEERVRALAAAETACCSFFTFTVTPLDPDSSHVGETATWVALDVEVPQERADLLGAILERASALGISQGQDRPRAR
ncbi:MAG: hypothetical protein WKF79_04505 [Nocardioides sp.]